MKRIRYLILIFFLFCSSERVFAQSEEEAPDVTTEEEAPVIRNISEAHWQKIKKDKGFIYTKPKPKKQQKKWNMDWLYALSPILRGFLYLLLALGIVFILYHILKNSEFRYLRGGAKREKWVEGYDMELEGEEDWEQALNQSILQRNFRLSIRILYRQTLHLLDKRNLIQYKNDKTNWEYVALLRSTGYGERFTQLTKYFEYVWYGHFVLDDKTFDHIMKSYREFQKELSS